MIEVLVVCGIVASIALTTAGVTLANRAPAVSSTALRFDALFATATATARAFNGGATLAFEPDPYGDGFVARLYQQRPATGPLVASLAPPLEARVSVRETATLGSPAFAFALHDDGTLAGIQGDVMGATVAAETPCPASGAYQLVFSYAGATATRSLPCSTPLAANGPVTVVAPPAAVPVPLPTAPPCVASACAVLPTPPSLPIPGS